MYIIPIAWLYVALMMSVAEATNSNGTVLGAIITFILYGLLPIALMLYFMGTPARKRRVRAQEAADRAAAMAAYPAHDNEMDSSQSSDSALVQPDASSQTTTDPVTAVRKEP